MWRRARRSLTRVRRGWVNITWKDSSSENTARRSAWSARGLRRKRRCQLAGIVGVGPRHHPRRRALEEVQAPDLGLDLGDELDRGGAGADDRDVAIGQVVVVVPAGRVENPSR